MGILQGICSCILFSLKKKINLGFTLIHKKVSVKFLCAVLAVSVEGNGFGSQIPKKIVRRATPTSKEAMKSLVFIPTRNRISSVIKNLQIQEDMFSSQ